MLNWFLGLAGIIMGVAIGQAVTNGTEGQRDTGRRFVIESFFSGSVPPAAISCYVSNGDMKYCMGIDREANDDYVATPAKATKLLARRSNNKNGLVAYGLGMRASNDETLWWRSHNNRTWTPIINKRSKRNVFTHNKEARSTWSMAGSGKRFIITYNIEKGWFSDNAVVGKLMAAKIARSSSSIIGVAFSTGAGEGETVYWEYGKDTATDLPKAGPGSPEGLFTGPAVSKGGASSSSFSEIVPGLGGESNIESPVITVVYEL